MPILLKEKFNSNKSNKSNSIQSEGCSKCQCSLTNKSYLKQKNIIIQNPFNKRTKLLKNYNNKLIKIIYQKPQDKKKF